MAVGSRGPNSGCLRRGRAPALRQATEPASLRDFGQRQTGVIRPADIPFSRLTKQLAVAILPTFVLPQELIVFLLVGHFKVLLEA